MTNNVTSMTMEKTRSIQQQRPCRRRRQSCSGTGTGSMHAIMSSKSTLLTMLILVVVAISPLSFNNLNNRVVVVDAFHLPTASSSNSLLNQQVTETVRRPTPGAATKILYMAEKYTDENEDDVHDQDLSEERLHNHDYIGRRSALGSMSTIVGGGLMSTFTLPTTQSVANAAVDYSSIDGDVFVPATRPTAYRVDSTQPPTLIPLDTARKEKKVLMDLGRGSGTDKEEIVDDSLNLNNMLNKAIFGTIDSVERAVGSKKDESKIGPGYASFVCMGLPTTTTKSSQADIDLAVSLSSTMIQARKESKNGIADTAFGLSFCPLSVQPALDVYSKTGDFNALQQALVDSGVDETTITQYKPLLRFLQLQSLDLLAMSPEYEDIKAARKDGLQSVDVSRRQLYVADPNGFISQTKDPKYKLYTDRSLLKDLPSNEEKVTGFFAERILVHETGATVLAKYAVRRPEAFVMMVAPIPDVRYLLGINGRIPRICKALNPEQNKVNDDAVTTILLNPTAEETLSQSRYLRLEIGTGPETLDYQTKVSDYLWFSSSPKVNMIPRLMNPK
mmetsp:Transcript_46876/g.114334  ORF Transcript_46876/g.114334 Transcript_46876/m.114334 type:complete len:560 (+) Transcript_46876:73-1752(+)